MGEDSHTPTACGRIDAVVLSECPHHAIIMSFVKLMYGQIIEKNLHPRLVLPLTAYV